MSEEVFRLDRVSVSYGAAVALRDVSLSIPARGVTALIGPSGSGKSTLLRTLNRMNDLVPGAHLEGVVTFRGADIHAPDTDLVDLRRRVGMIFQRSHAFPGSIFDNVAYGPRLHGRREGLDQLVQGCLTRAGLWDEVRDDLAGSAEALSGGQQQRLAVARCLAVEPEVILMDEPTSSLDPVATATIEGLIRELAQNYPIVLVTHHLGQAVRVSDHTAFLAAETDADGARYGVLVEFAASAQLFGDPSDPRTRAYVTGAGA